MARSGSTTGKPAIPSHQEMKKPLLALLKRKGEVSLEEALTHMAKKFGVSERARKKMNPSGHETTFQNRLRWARWELKNEGVIETTRRGYFRLVNGD